MKNSTKLSLFYVAVLAVFCVLALSLAAVLHTVSAGYNALLETPVRQMDQARVVQVGFKKQVQEWKDILLRGHDPEDLANYTRQFHERRSRFTMARTFWPDRFRIPKRGNCLSNSWRRMRRSAKNTNWRITHTFQNADFKAADKIVRGQRPYADRPF